jgi:ABC-type lipoprotein release transport system permease subunit
VAPLLLSLVALLTVWIPARRAVRVNPMNALRFE